MLFTPATSMQRFFEAVPVLGRRENEPLIPGTPAYLAASGNWGGRTACGAEHPGLSNRRGSDQA